MNRRSGNQCNSADISPRAIAIGVLCLRRSFSSTLGEAGINIATFHVGREAPGANAVALIEIDGELPDKVLAKVRALPQVQQSIRRVGVPVYLRIRS